MRVLILCALMFACTSFHKPTDAQLDKFKKDIIGIWGKDLQKKKRGASPFLRSDSQFMASKPRITVFNHFTFFHFKTLSDAKESFDYLKKVGRKEFKYQCEVCWGVFDKAGVCYMIYKNWIISIGKRCADNKPLENNREDEFYNLYKPATNDTSFMRTECGGTYFSFK